MIPKTNNISSAKFTWEKYCSKVGYSTCETWNMNTNRPNPGYEEIGRCPASSLVVRPRDRGEGVMLRCIETGDEFWHHVLSDKDMGVEL